MVDEKFRSRRWILANNILNWSRFFSLLVLLISATLAIDSLGSIIIGVLTFLGAVHTLVYGAYTANRAYTDHNKKGDE